MVTVINRTPDEVAGRASSVVVRLSGARLDLGEVDGALGPGQRRRLEAIARAEVSLRLTEHRVVDRGPLTPVVAVWLMLVVLTAELYFGLRRPLTGPSPTRR